MTALALALSLGLAPEAPPPTGVLAWSGRLVDEPHLHIGLRPAAFLDDEAQPGWEWGVGLTFQLTTDAPAAW